MSNQPILITGCQRSGTTLLNLVLGSHPEIHAIDEMEFDPDRGAAYLSDPSLGPRVCFKQPTWASDLPAMQGIPGLKVLWVVRDPRAATASMITLQLDFKGIASPWAAHPLGGGREIRNCLGALEKLPPDLQPALQAYVDDLAVPPGRWSTDQCVRAGALCWRLKNELPDLYRKVGMDFRLVVYEHLVSDPRGELGPILEYLGAPWDDAVLGHHRLRQGMAVGGTDRGRAIDTSSMERWRERLTSPQLETIRTICGPLAGVFGYTL